MEGPSLRETVQICPLSFASPRSTCPCLKEGCAWWHEKCEQCAILSLPRIIDNALGVIAFHLGER